MVSSIQPQGGNIQNDYDGKSGKICISQQCDKTVITIHNALQEAASLTRDTTTPMKPEESLHLEGYLKALAWHCKFQATHQTLQLAGLYFYVWSWRCFIMTSTSTRNSSEVRPSCTTHPYAISFSLSQLCRTPEGTTYVSYYGHHFFWLHIANNVHMAVNDGHPRAKHGLQTKQKCKVQLFSVAGLLQVVAIDILRPLPTETSYNQHVFIVTKRYSGLTHGIATGKISSTHLANIFLGIWILFYYIPT